MMRSGKARNETCRNIARCQWYHVQFDVAAVFLPGVPLSYPVSAPRDIDGSGQQIGSSIPLVGRLVRAACRRLGLRVADTGEGRPERAGTVIADRAGERLLFGVHCDAGLGEHHARDAALTGALGLVVRDRLPGLREDVSVVLSEEQNVCLGGVHPGHARLAAGDGLSGELLKHDRFMTDCLYQAGEGVTLSLEATADAADEHLHDGNLPEPADTTG